MRDLDAELFTIKLRLGFFTGLGWTLCVLAILISPAPAPSSLHLWAQCVEAEQKARKALTMDLPPTSDAAQEMLKGRGD